MRWEASRPRCKNASPSVSTGLAKGSRESKRSISAPLPAWQACTASCRGPKAERPKLQRPAPWDLCLTRPGPPRPAPFALDASYPLDAPIVFYMNSFFCHRVPYEGRASSGKFLNISAFWSNPEPVNTWGKYLEYGGKLCDRDIESRQYFILVIFEEDSIF